MVSACPWYKFIFNGDPLPKKLLIVLLAFMLCLTALPAFAENEPSEPEKAWFQLIADKQRELAFTRQTTRKIEAQLKAQRKRLRSTLRDLERRYFELLFLLRSSWERPYSTSLIYQDIQDINARINQTLRPFEVLEKNLDMSRDNIRQGVKELGIFAGREHSPELKRALMKLRRNMASMAVTIKRLEVNAASTGRPLRELQTRTSRELEELRDRLGELWLGLFLNTDMTPLSFEYWEQLPYFFEHWLSVLPQILSRHLPSQRRGISEIVLTLILLWLPFIALGLWLYKIYRPRIAGNKMASRQLFSFWVVAGLGMSLLVYTGMGEYPGTWLWDVLAMIALARAALMLGAALLNFALGRQNRRCLVPVFWLYVTAAGVQFLGAPLQVMGAVWPVCLIAGFWFERRYLVRDLSSVERLVVRVSLFVMVLALLLSLTGLLLLSIYLIIAWLMAAAGLQIIWAAMQLLQRLPQDGEGRPWQRYGLAPGLGGPVLGLIYLLTVMDWMAHHLGGSQLMARAVTWSFQWRGLDISFADLLLIVILFVACRYVVNLLGAVLSRIKQWSRVDSAVIPSLQAISKYMIWLLFGYIVLALLGLDLTSLLVILGGMSVGVGFGLQHVVANFTAGLIILMGRTLRQGDVIEVGGRRGHVIKINLRSTVVRTFDNSMIFVPNQDIISKDLTNWTRGDPKVRCNIEVGVAYGSDLELASKLLLECAAGHKNVLEFPRPDVLFKEFADSALTLVLRVWIDRFDRYLTVESDLRGAINQSFSEHGVEIAFPQMDVHVKETPQPAEG